MTDAAIVAVCVLVAAAAALLLGADDGACEGGDDRSLGGILVNSDVENEMLSAANDDAGQLKSLQ